MLAGQVYHIYNHANGSENLFKEEDNYRYFLNQYTKYIYPLAKTYAYCLLPNHFHFLIQIKSEKELFSYISLLNNTEKSTGTFPKFETLEKFVSKQFSNFFSSYTQGFNKVYNRKGSLFVKNFKRKLIETETQFQDTFLYINLNPVKHGFVNDGKDWYWSSFNSYLDSNKESLLERKLAILYFDSHDNLKYCLNEKSETILNMNFE